MLVCLKPFVRLTLADQNTYLHHIDPIGAFYGDLPAEEAEKRKAAIKHHSIATLKSPLGYAAYKHIPTTYLLSTNDQKLPYERQKELVEAAGVEITSVTCDEGHSPFLSQPKLVVEIIRKAAGEQI
jgi:homoserine acetyltransferase